MTYSERAPHIISKDTELSKESKEKTIHKTTVISSWWGQLIWTIDAKKKKINVYPNQYDTLCPEEGFNPDDVYDRVYNSILQYGLDDVYLPLVQFLQYKIMGNYAHNTSCINENNEIVNPRANNSILHQWNDVLQHLRPSTIQYPEHAPILQGTNSAYIDKLIEALCDGYTNPVSTVKPNPASITT